jgi:ATP-dependent Clp protease ATP-binding subunit ClpB
MQLDISDAAKSCMSERGFEVRYGARPLKRALVKDLLNPLRRLVLEGGVREGDAVKVRTRGEAMQLERHFWVGLLVAARRLETRMMSSF